MRYCRNCRKNVADEFKFCPVCGAETEESKEEILFPKEDIANLKTELAFTKDDLNREIKFLKDEIKKVGQKDSGAIKRITRIHVYEFAIFTGTVSALSGFILSMFLASLIAGIMQMIPALSYDPKASNGPVIFVILVTAFYFIAGFIIGAIYAFGYNFITSVTGGVKITLSSEYED